MALGYLHENWLFRAWENITTNIKMETKGWMTFGSIVGSPLLVSSVIYFISKMMERREMQLERISLKHFTWFDMSMLVYLGVGGVLTLLVAFLFGKKILDYVKAEKKKLVSDEYVRGAKLVCNDEFNEQFAEYDNFIEINVIEEQCTRKF
ncbi:hypothetical protein [Aliarcobacter butzleri]|uniref:hypothetical protein n=1 Tax=Aliarcobacter butzleri TaxID=28197 RepID=UPI00125EF2B2|nr:hypothetical protein [Aliarcobacter butzleri]